MAATKEFLAYGEEAFSVPSDVKAHMESLVESLAEEEVCWNELMTRYETSYPELFEEWKSWLKNSYVKDIEGSEGFWEFNGSKATRISSYEVLNKIEKIVPNLIGGSADLAPSTKSLMEVRGHFTPEDHSGSNLHFGVREHAMAAMANGIALHGGTYSLCGRFPLCLVTI